MVRLSVYGPLVAFTAYVAIIRFQDQITYLNWLSDDWAIVVSTRRPSVRQTEAVAFRTSDGETLRGLWGGGDAPDGWRLANRPVILFCDGNAGSVEHACWVVDRWASMIGAEVLLFDYRGYGKSTGRPCEDGLYCDGRAAYDWLVKQKRIDPRRIILVGQSLGGGVALYLAERVEHRMLILESTFTSLRDSADHVFFPAPMGAFCLEEFPNLDRIRRYRKPVFISHGDRDGVAPCRHGERLASAAAGPSAFWKCEGMGHDDRRDEARYVALVRAFLERHWRDTSAGPSVPPAEPRIAVARTTASAGVTPSGD